MSASPQNYATKHASLCLLYKYMLVTHRLHSTFKYWEYRECESLLLHNQDV